MPNGRRVTLQAIRGPALLAALLAAALLAGCAPRVGAGETSQIGPQTSAPADPPLLLDLPALVLTYDAAGAPGVGGSVPLGDLHDLLPETLIRQLTLDAPTVQQVRDAGIRYIMLSNTPSGLRILVNGQQLPTLVWNQESLDNLIDLVGPNDEAAAAQLSNLAAAVLNLGVGVVVQFSPGSVTSLPATSDGDGQSNASLAQVYRQEFAQRVGEAPVIHIPVEYAADGTWTVGGIPDTEWQALTGLPLGYLRLNPQTISAAAEAGIRQVVLWTDADGIHLTVGERMLPYLRWADGNFLTVLHLLETLGYLPFESQAHPEAYQLIERELLPALQTTDLHIAVNFPTP